MRETPESPGHVCAARVQSMISTVIIDIGIYQNVSKRARHGHIRVTVTKSHAKNQTTSLAICITRLPRMKDKDSITI